MVDLIDSLVTKSLLVAELAGREERYRLLESSRQYARDKLIARGEHEQVAWRHASAYAQLAEQLESAWDSTPDWEWVQQSSAELGNWRLALEWALAKRRGVLLGQRLAAASHVMWCSRSTCQGTSIGCVWRSSWSDERAPPGLLARLELAQADGARRFADSKAFLSAASSLERYRDLGDGPGRAWALSMTGAALVLLVRPVEDVATAAAALEAARTLGERRLTAVPFKLM